jgi:hypothetical protein
MPSRTAAAADDRSIPYLAGPELVWAQSGAVQPFMGGRVWLAGCAALVVLSGPGLR